jgi:hypothetical protein
MISLNIAILAWKIYVFLVPPYLQEFTTYPEGEVHLPTLGLV